MPKYAWDYGEDIIDRITVERLVEDLSEEDREILRELYVNDETQAVVARYIADKYRDGKLTPSGLRWLRDQIFGELRAKLTEDGVRGLKG